MNIHVIVQVEESEESDPVRVWVALQRLCDLIEQDGLVESCLPRSEEHDSLLLSIDHVHDEVVPEVRTCPECFGTPMVSAMCTRCRGAGIILE